MEQNPQLPENKTTEAKIKEAARRVFMKKGYAATRTRDIAEESGFNLALINYYFRSKEKLFEIIMLENLQLFAGNMLVLLNNRDTTLEQKLEQVVSHYIDMFTENPDMPLFVLSEINDNPENLMKKMGNREQVENVYLLQQWREKVAMGAMANIHPLHLFINLAGLTVFPFIASPLLRAKTKMSMEDFHALMQERKKLIPIWLKGILAADADKPLIKPE